MPSVLALPVIYEAIVSKLRADATLVAMLAAGMNGVFNVAPTNSPFPYVEVGLGTEVPFDTMGPDGEKKWGSDTTLQITARTASSGSGSDLPVLRIMSRAKAVLVAQPLSVQGFPSVVVSFESMSPIFQEVIDGRNTRTGGLIVRVVVHEGQP